MLPSHADILIQLSRMDTTAVMPLKKRPKCGDCVDGRSRLILVTLVLLFNVVGVVKAQPCPPGTSIHGSWALISGCQRLSVTEPGGDTCNHIAQRFSITAAQVQDWNQGICCSEDPSHVLAGGHAVCIEGPAALSPYSPPTMPSPPYDSPSPSPVSLPSPPTPPPATVTPPPSPSPVPPPPSPSPVPPPPSPSPVTPPPSPSPVPPPPSPSPVTPPPSPSPVTPPPPPSPVTPPPPPSPLSKHPPPAGAPGLLFPPLPISASTTPELLSPPPVPPSSGIPVPSSSTDGKDGLSSTSGKGIGSLIPAVLIPALVVLVGAAVIVYWQKTGRRKRYQTPGVILGKPEPPTKEVNAGFINGSESFGKSGMRHPAALPHLTIDIHKQQLHTPTYSRQASMGSSTELSRSHVVSRLSPRGQDLGQDLAVAISVALSSSKAKPAPAPTASIATRIQQSLVAPFSSVTSGHTPPSLTPKLSITPTRTTPLQTPPSVSPINKNSRFQGTPFADLSVQGDEKWLDDEETQQASSSPIVDVSQIDLEKWTAGLGPSR